MVILQFGSNVVEQFLWESYNIDSRKHLYKMINEADDDNARKQVSKNRILQDYFLLRRGRDPGFAFHVYEMIKADPRAFKSTVFYIQKLLLDSACYDENQIFSPCSSNETPNKNELAIDKNLKHTIHFPMSFEERGDGYVNINFENINDHYLKKMMESTNESIQYFEQRYEIALEEKDDLTTDAVRDLIEEYKTGYYSFDYFGKKQKFYWDSPNAKRDNYDYIKYISESIVNHQLYEKTRTNSETELAINILGLGLEDDFLQLLNKYDINITSESQEGKLSLRYIKFLTDAFSITSTIWFNSLSLKEKETLLNGLYPLNEDAFTNYLSYLDKDNNTFSFQFLLMNMYSNGFLDIAELICKYIVDTTKDNYEKAIYIDKLGDIYREKLDYETSLSMYNHSFDLLSKIHRIPKRRNQKTVDYRSTPKHASIISFLRIAEIEFLLNSKEAEGYLKQAKEKIERTNAYEKLSLMWNLACTYRRIGQFDQEYDTLDYLASLGEYKRDDLVNQANERLIEYNDYILDSGELDNKKLAELELNSKYHKLISIADRLKNSFQFERESEYRNIALKVKDSDLAKFELATCRYNQNDLCGAKEEFKLLIPSQDHEIKSLSSIYLGLIYYQQKNDEDGFNEILNGIMPYIMMLGSTDFTCNEDSKDATNELEYLRFDKYMKSKIIESLQPIIELCFTNLIAINKVDSLDGIIDYIIDSSSKICPSDAHLAFTYIIVHHLFSKGLVEEAVALSTESIEHFDEVEIKVAAFDMTANLYFLLGEHTKSMQFLDEAIKLSSHYPAIWKNQALNYEQLLDFKKAEGCIDKALEIEPGNPSLISMKEKFSQLKKNTINFTDIKDNDIKKFFMSAERLVLDVSKSVNEDEFDFTMALVSYGKGLESLLHKEVSKPLRNKIHSRYGSPISSNYFVSLPKSLKNILGEKERTITLGSWSYIMEDCNKKKLNPVINDSRDYFAGKLNKNKDIIFDSCRTVSEYRNGSAHYTSKSMDEILEDRKMIVEQINKVIGILCSRGSINT